MVCWNDIWNAIQGISAPVSAIGTLLMTYYVYRLTNRRNKKESYFRHMVDSYYRIEEDGNMLFMLDEKDFNNFVLVKEQCKRRIAVNSALMNYYLLRIPGYYDDRWKFFAALYSLSRYPDDIERYSELSREFEKFCWNYKDKKEKVHSFKLEYDGKPIEK